MAPFADPRAGGIGGILRDSLASKWFDQVSLVVECDCEIIVDWFSGSERTAHSFILDDVNIFEALGKDWWSIHHVSRKFNGTADKLAKAGIEIVLAVYWESGRWCSSSVVVLTASGQVFHAKLLEATFKCWFDIVEV